MMTTTPNFHLDLPRVPLAATAPPEVRGVARDEVRLLTLNRESGEIQHGRFFDLPTHLNPGDLVVVNDSQTVPGRLRAVYQGEPLYIHMATKLDATEHIVERRSEDGGPDGRPFSSGAVIHILDHSQSGPKPPVVATLCVLKRFHPKSRLWHVQSDVDLFDLASRCGVPIRYHYVPHSYGSEYYQTMFARRPGSAEMPSAARPFTKRTVRELAERGVEVRTLTLHTGVSSHEVEGNLDQHPILPEWYEIPPATAAAVNEAKARGRRVIAVGTTVVRALESAAVRDQGRSLDRPPRIHSGSDWTTHLVTPDTPPQIVTGLVTGFHESQSSHLALLYAFVPEERLLNAYRVAVEHDYLWHEFGDINLIL